MLSGRLSHIKAISFDGDMTLWDFRKVMRSALGHTLEELQRRRPVAAATLTIERMIEIRQAVAAELKGRVTNLEEIRFQAFRRTLESIGMETIGGVISQCMHCSRTSGWRSIRIEHHTTNNRYSVGGATDEAYQL